MPQAITPIAETPQYFEASQVACLSADGHWLAFKGFDGDGTPRIFLQNLETGAVSGLAGQAASWRTDTPVFSADGNKLAFKVRSASGAPDQIWIQDLHTGQLQLASADAQGRSIGTGDRFSLSGDGKFLVFSNSSDNLVAGDQNGYIDVFLKDLTTGALSLVSSNGLGQAGNGYSMDAQISRDGHSVVFRSSANNLLGGQGNTNHLYVKDLQTGSLRYVDASASGDPIGVSALGANPIFSADGSKIAYHSFERVQVKDLVSGALIDPATLADGTPLSGSAFARPFMLAGFSADGRFVTFSYAGKVGMAGDADSYVDVFQKDLQTGSLQLLTPHGNRPGTGAFAISASDDGKTVVFSAAASGLGGPDVATNRDPGPNLYIASLNAATNLNGNDTLIATSAGERLAGGSGDDRYWINDASTVILEAASAGNDTVLSSLASYTLPDNVDNLQLSTNADLNMAQVAHADGTGNDLNNRITGNAQSNILRGMGGDDFLVGGPAESPIGGSGNDTIDGGTGMDIVGYAFSFSGAGISKVAGGVQVVRKLAPTGTDLLQNVERIQFSDLALSLPGDTHAAQAYRIYQAAFNRTPDSAGLGFWVKQIDNGAALSEGARGFMQSNEFKALYGEPPANGDIVSKFYQNVLHRAPDAGGLKFWTDVLDSGRGTPEYVLAQFSESPENVAALTGVIDAGFTFKPFV